MMKDAFEKAGFSKDAQVENLKETIKELEYSCATLQRHNDQLVERIRKLSSINIIIFKQREIFE